MVEVKCITNVTWKRPFYPLEHQGRLNGNKRKAKTFILTLLVMPSSSCQIKKEKGSAKLPYWEICVFYFTWIFCSVDHNSLTRVKPFESFRRRSCSTHFIFYASSHWLPLQASRLIPHGIARLELFPGFKSHGRSRDKGDHGSLLSHRYGTLRSLLESALQSPFPFNLYACYIFNLSALAWGQQQRSNSIKISGC